MLPQEIIRKKRDGGMLSAGELDFLMRGLAEGTVTQGQGAAFAMAVFFNGMDWNECVALTTAMRDSGQILDWTGLDGPALDKHSTGGVGDNVSLVLAPAVTACGAYVPMISGRGLGHTGGTLDKLDSIPGYQSQADIESFRRTVRQVGCAIIGPTSDIAPADGRLYAIRDVTATVESIPLITASILAKKLAAGLDCLVLDVKAGNGAFMQTDGEAKILAESLVAVANGAGLRTSALITDMNQPLGSAAGNALELRNAIGFLAGLDRDARLEAVVLELGAELLLLSGLASDEGNARKKIEVALSSGRAAEIFGRMVSALGGPADLVENPDAHLVAAEVVKAVMPARPGMVQAIDTRAVGLAVVELGGGRTQPGARIDHAVGFTALAAIGDIVGGDEPLAIVHARTEAAADEAAESLRAAYEIGNGPARESPLLREKVV
jgi:thymidine phosphorylase